MCMNCGCGVPDAGGDDVVTIETLLKAARAAGNKNLREAMENMLWTYKKMIKGTPDDTRPVA